MIVLNATGNTGHKYEIGSSANGSGVTAGSLIELILLVLQLDLLSIQTEILELIQILKHVN